MRNLVIDIGNTLSKVAFFNDRVIQEVNISKDFSAKLIEDIVAGEALDAAIISSVDDDVTAVENFLNTKCKYVRFSASSANGICNKYKTPNTLGLDRLAVVIGAAAVCPGQNILVIDAGTCITYDFIDSEKNYYGGSISPGINMRYKAMNEFTSRLPLVDFDPDFDWSYGDDTRTAMVSGVQQGILNEVIGFIKIYNDRYPGLQTLICGGDSAFFDSRLKNSIFAHSFKTEQNLVLIGLNEVIYQHND